ncbi:AAA family ATPase [Lacrimispora sp.]|uniref:AAA family ATPase n=1 Tax=Lacrimispora sp. TaxID=2719234 RepID=UPI003991DEC1
MKINRIVLYNFNSYEGLNEFDFTSNDGDKNIILIGGKNGAGKTSLFTAIKIALYGPLAFGYVGVNSTYIAKIKDCINSKTFQKDVVKSYVQISVSLMVEREIKEYEITREWDYTKQKLEEDYFVISEGHRLDEQELSYFQNYLQGMIPPDLFEFFLFDGEEVGSIFSTSTYNTYVKNAVYTLCGLDVFEIIRKYTTGYAGKSNSVDEDEIHAKYEELRCNTEKIEADYAELESQNVVNQEELEKIETELTEVETAFKNAGGITEAERQTLLKEFTEAEHIKTESLTKIKLFVEGLMPFFILRDFTGKISDQLDFEEKGEIFYYIQQKLKKHEIKETLNESQNVSDETVDDLLEFILKKFKPKGFKEGDQPVHDLSKEGIGRVNAMISSIDDFDVEAMIQLVENRKAAAEKTMEINRILKNAMTDEDAGKFSEKENALLKKKDEITSRIHASEMHLANMKDELTIATQQRDRAFQTIKDNAQNKHVFELSSGLSQMMGSMLSVKTESIKRNLEKLIVENLQHIYRKNNLITHIEIEDDFQFNLYQNVRYSNTELLHLIRNLGKDVFATEIGKKGMEILCKKYKVDSVQALQQELSSDEYKNTHNLYKRIDISRLSKGERQIFILSLYWAIIELSGQDIPFIIDTPYARIDANHRKEISEKFFPNISKQVVILSTDEEINEEYYGIIKPHIAKEYLLINDESQNRTTVEQHYFFEV